MKIFLADLTYTQATLASDVVPAAIGGLAEILERDCAVQVEIFKLPEVLLAKLEKEQPDILGFSNYIWNSTLSSKIANYVKLYFPKIITITGGPNVPSEREELNDFLISHRSFDYAVLKEGEAGIVNLVNLLIRYKKPLNPDELSLDEIKGFGFLDSENELVMGELIRYMNLEDLPSPYLSGRLDSYLDGRFLPVLQTNRGCPFTCTFCTEGQSSWSKVRRKPVELMGKEVSYIANFMANTSNARGDLLIADSNFGMYESDLIFAEEIAKVQKEMNYPTYINVATGKNKKERVLETARIVNGAMKLAGSVQSLDVEVLKNIKRDNISADGLMQMAMEAASIGTNTYSEVILGLPGDTMLAHFETLKKLIDAGFTTIAMYQMMLLPATSMNSLESRRNYDFQTKFRLLPRCFGYFDFMGQTFRSAEIEEIVVAHQSLSQSDYLSCRVMNLLVTLFYNDGIFLEFHRLLKQLGGSSFEWINQIYKEIPKSDLNQLIESFKNDTLNELWNSRLDLEDAVEKTNLVNDAINGLAGHNILFLYKSKSLSDQLDQVFNLASNTYLNYLKNLLPHNSQIVDFVHDMFAYRNAQVSGVLNGKKSFSQHLINFSKTHEIMSELEVGNNIDLVTMTTTSESIYGQVQFTLTENQNSELQSYVSLFGSTDIGKSRILSRIFIRNFFRKPFGIESNSQRVVSAVPSAQFGFRET